VGILVPAQVDGSASVPLLTPFAGRTLLGQCLARLKATGANVIVVTTTRPSDDVIVREASRYRADVHRSADGDLLGRLLEAAEAFRLSDVACASAIHPAVDIEAPARVVALRRRARVDSVTECGLPVGAAVDVVTVDALRRAHHLASTPHQRQYVTSFIRRDSRFTTLCAVAPGMLRRPGLRLVADTPAMIGYLHELFSVVGGDAPLATVLDIAARRESATGEHRSQRGA
jgi:spore coat polysaccharide biosynthesis protein SpsF